MCSYCYAIITTMFRISGPPIVVACWDLCSIQPKMQICQILVICTNPIPTAAYMANSLWSNNILLHALTVWDITWMSDQSVHFAKWMTKLEQVTVRHLTRFAGKSLPRCLGVACSSAGIHLAKCTEWSLIRVTFRTELRTLIPGGLKNGQLLSGLIIPWQAKSSA